MHELVVNTINNDPLEAQKYAQQELQITQDNTPEKVDAMNDMGNVYYYLDEYEKGEEILLKSMEMAKSINYQNGLGEGALTMGYIFLLKGQYSDALEKLTIGIEVFEAINNDNGLAQCYNVMGSINYMQENYEKALEYFEKALKYGDKITQSDSYVNMSQIYMSLESFSEAKKFSEMALELGKENEDNYVIASSLDLLGQVLTHDSQFQSSLEKLFEALDLKESLQDDQGTSATLYYIGLNYKYLNQIDTALNYITQSYETAKSIGANEEMRLSLSELAKLHAIKEDYSTAFNFQTMFIEINEAMRNDKASKKIAEMENQLAQKIKEDQILMMEQEKEHSEMMFKIYVWAGIFILLMILLGAGAIYKRYTEKKKAHAEMEAKNHIIEQQKHVLLEQKHVLEEKNTEIMDSITYAKRIQTAILPSDRFFQEKLPEAFVLYKPKDIIAGDFYWLEDTGNKILFAAADCTGHGVPGAMVSVVCNNALNRSVREFSLLNPAKVLDKTRELVIEQFEKSESEVKDGMDISICAFEKGNEISKLEWAGANNPIWIVRKISQGNLKAINLNENELQEFEPNKTEGDYNLFEIKADKQPIGKYTKPYPFTSWSIEMKKEDALYVFTDGYADQFGGDKGKKFLGANFKKLFLKIQEAPIQNHKKMIDDVFEEYVQGHEQIDDVCVIGVRV